jgi:hypothetical protein
VTLHGLARAASVDQALAELRSGEVRPYVARVSDNGSTILWEGDHEYGATGDGGGADGGDRHRLVMDRLPWVYVDTLEAGR